jgi:hypothetical protein
MFPFTQQTEVAGYIGAIISYGACAQLEPTANVWRCTAWAWVYSPRIRVKRLLPKRMDHGSAEKALQRAKRDHLFDVGLSRTEKARQVIVAPAKPSS